MHLKPWQIRPYFAPEGDEGSESGDDSAGAQEGDDGAQEGAEGAGEGGAKWFETFDNDDAKAIAARYTDPQAMALATKDLRERNSKMINVPGEDADEETVSKFRKAIGASGNVEDYAKDMDWSAYGADYEPTEAQVEELGAFAALAADKGMPVGVFNDFAQEYTKMQAEMVEAIREESAAVQETYTTELKQLWGADFDRNMALSQAGIARVAKATGSDVEQLQQLMKAPLKHADVMIGNHPAMVKLMVMSARMLGEDSAADMGDVSGRSEGLQNELTGLEEKMAKGANQLTASESKRRIEIYETLESMGALPGQQKAG